jgi:hypothetical protein
MPKDFVQVLTLASRDSGTFNNTFQVVSSGLAEACFLLRIVNDSNIDVLVSYDGLSNHDYVPSGQELNLNLQTNSQPGNWTALIKKGTPVYVKGAIAGVGSVFVAGYYQK